MRLILLSIVFAVAASPASAHYQMLLPDKASVKKGEKVTIIYQWGHPYEHQLFDAPKPISLVVLPMGGKAVDLLDKVEAIEIDSGEKKKVKAWRLQYTPEERGDYVFILQAAPIFLEEEGIFVVDTVKMVVHVEAQKGWDAHRGEGAFVFNPLTRPYGLQPGLTFQARLAGTREQQGRRVDSGGPGVSGGNVVVEVEPYHATTPKTLPPDEQMTRVVKTDPNGVVTTTLPDAGWWGLTATRDHGKTLEHECKPHPVKQRTTLWVFVDDKPR